MNVVIGTRASDLAMAQTQIVADALRARDPNLQVTLRPMRTEGDRRSTASLAEIGGTGVFVKELEAALRRHEIDLAVHSLKDVPPRLESGLCLSAFLRREDPRDVLVSRNGEGIRALARGSVVGTGSTRRSAQLRALRPDLQIHDIRGNVPTRLRKLDEGKYDALVLAVAGLKRLGLSSRVSETFDVDVMVPAVGQGALTIETRQDSSALRNLVALLDDADTRAAVTAERSFLLRLGAGCETPVGAYAQREGNDLVIFGMIARADESIARLSMRGAMAEAEALGQRLAERLSVEAGAPLPRQEVHV